MLYLLIFLFVSLMYLKYILIYLDYRSFKMIKFLPIGLLIGSFAIFLVKWLTPTNYLAYDGCNLMYFEIENGKIIFKYFWELSYIKFEILRNYIFTGFIEEICKLSAGFLIFMAYRKKKLNKLFLYIVLSAVFFAFIENLQYLERLGPSVILLRSLLSTTTHISLGLILGYYALLALSKEKRIHIYLTMLLGLLITTFLHGSFNFALYMNNMQLNILVWITLVLIGLNSLKKAKNLM